MKVGIKNTSTTTHGGTWATWSPDTFADGENVLRVGDILNCPKHGPNPITTGFDSVDVNDKVIAVIGSRTACGAVIVTGSSDVLTD